MFFIASLDACSLLIWSLLFNTRKHDDWRGCCETKMQKVEEKFVGIEKKCVTLPARLQKHYHNY
jgi:hypothetical protein